MAGETEGSLSPHFLMLAVTEGDAPNPGSALAIGIGFTPTFAADEIGCNWARFSGQASASARVELDQNEVIALGNSPAWAGDLTSAYAVIQTEDGQFSVHAGTG